VLLATLRNPLDLPAALGYHGRMDRLYRMATLLHGIALVFVPWSYFDCWMMAVWMPLAATACIMDEIAIRRRQSLESSGL
jgi:hypothetical protein